MTPGSVARRYAKALYELASEEHAVSEVRATLAEVAAAIEDVGRDALAEGMLETSARREIGLTLADPVGRESTLGKFLCLLAERDRLAHLPAIYGWYVKLEDAAAGRVQLAIAAANKLKDADVDAIGKVFAKIADRQVVAHVRTDPEILGGVIVELEGRVYDGSVRTALARLATRMAGGGGGTAGASTGRRGRHDADQSV